MPLYLIWGQVPDGEKHVIYKVHGTKGDIPRLWIDPELLASDMIEISFLPIVRQYGQSEYEFYFNIKNLENKDFLQASFRGDRDVLKQLATDLASKIRDGEDRLLSEETVHSPLTSTALTQLEDQRVRQDRFDDPAYQKVESSKEYRGHFIVSASGVGAMNKYIHLFGGQTLNINLTGYDRFERPAKIYIHAQEAGYQYPRMVWLLFISYLKNLPNYSSYRIAFVSTPDSKGYRHMSFLAGNNVIIYFYIQLKNEDGSFASQAKFDKFWEESKNQLMGGTRQIAIFRLPQQPSPDHEIDLSVFPVENSDDQPVSAALTQEESYERRQDLALSNGTLLSSTAYDLTHGMVMRGQVSIEYAIEESNIYLPGILIDSEIFSDKKITVLYSQVTANGKGRHQFILKLLNSSKNKYLKLTFVGSRGGMIKLRKNISDQIIKEQKATLSERELDNLHSSQVSLDDADVLNVNISNRPCQNYGVKMSGMHAKTVLTSKVWSYEKEITISGCQILTIARDIFSNDRSKVIITIIASLGSDRDFQLILLPFLSELYSRGGVARPVPSTPDSVGFYKLIFRSGRGFSSWVNTEIRIKFLAENNILLGKKKAAPFLRDLQAQIDRKSGYLTAVYPLPGNSSPSRAVPSTSASLEADPDDATDSASVLDPLYLPKVYPGEGLPDTDGFRSERDSKANALMIASNFVDTYQKAPFEPQVPAVEEPARAGGNAIASNEPFSSLLKKSINSFNKVFLTEMHSNANVIKALTKYIQSSDSTLPNAIYLEAFLVDVHQADMDAFNRGEEISPMLKARILAAEGESGESGYYEALFKASQGKGIPVMALDIATARLMGDKLSSMDAPKEVNRVTMMNLPASKILNAAGGTWIAVMGAAHANPELTCRDGTVRRINTSLNQLVPGVVTIDVQDIRGESSSPSKVTRQKTSLKYSGGY